MLRIIYGAKGSGKTQKISAEANEMVEKSSGSIVFLTYTDRYKFELNYNISIARQITRKTGDTAVKFVLAGQLISTQP